MPYVFEHLDLVREIIGRSPLGLITDVDGTISEIAHTPRQAKVSPLCRHYLRLLRCHMDLVAVVSGRSVAEVRDMLGIDGVVYIGNHGLERWVKSQAEFPGSSRDYSGLIKSAFEELSSRLSIEGVKIENKGLSLTVHYRLSPHPEMAEREILNTLEASERAKGLRIVRGKLAVNLLPSLEVNKGTAVLDLVQNYSLQGCLYMGDDLTDIDAFRAVRSASISYAFQGLAIGVISVDMPKGLVREVDLTLKEISDVERFLRWLTQNVPRLD